MGRKDSGLLPGPGNYKLPDKVATGPKYQIAQKYIVKDRSIENPGPGTYNLQG